MNIPASISTALQKKYPVGIAKVIAFSLLLALPACRIPKLSQAESGPILPAGFNTATEPEVTATPRQLATGAGLGSAALGGWISKEGSAAKAPSSDNSSQLGVDEFFNDMMLSRLIQHALAGNRELKIMDQEIQIAGNEILARQGAYLPFVTLGTGGGFDKTSRYTRNGAVEDGLTILPDKPFPNPLTNTQVGLNFNWELDIWRKLRNARDAAGQLYLAAVEKRNYFVTRLVAEIAENYYRLLALDKRMETLDKTIENQEKSLEVSKAFKEAGRLTELPVQRFQAEVRKNQSEKLIVRQEVVEAENRINFLLNRYPAPVERAATGFLDLTIRPLSVGLPSQLLQNRADIRQAERELAAAGLDVKVAKARFFPTLSISAGVGYEAFNPRYIFNPEAFAANVVGNLVAPLINKKEIQAVYLTANAKQLESIYNYQRVILNAYTEVVNRVTMAENYRKSIEIKKQQLESLEASVVTATQLFQNARAEYVEVLLAQRDLLEARTVLIETKKQQLSAIVNAYQALGGGNGQANAPQMQLPVTALGRPALFERFHHEFYRHPRPVDSQ